MEVTNNKIKTVAERSRSYEHYKDSGVEWLGDIPEHWDIKKVKYLFKIGRGRVIAQTELDDNGLYPVYSSQTLNDGILGYINTYDFEDTQLTWTTDGANAGTVFLRKGKYNCTNVCGTLKPKSDLFSIFFTKYILQVASHYYKRPDTNGAKIMNNEMAEIILTFPPLIEQTAIANFLDEKTTKIDEAVAIKEQQIELLKERKQILIHKAVTRGLDDNVTLKDSGVEWIGEIPKHWEVKRLKYIAELNYGISPNEKTYNSDGIGTVLVNGPVEYSKTDFGYTRSLKWTTEPVKFAKKGDLLFCLRGSTTGRLNICHQDLSIGRGCASIRAKENHQFLIKSIIALKDQIIQTFKGSTFPSITSFELNNYFIPTPPLSEQKEIATYTEDFSQKIDTAINLKQQEIAKLQEYKSSLINSVVTGKVRVC